MIQSLGRRCHAAGWAHGRVAKRPFREKCRWASPSLFFRLHVLLAPLCAYPPRFYLYISKIGADLVGGEAAIDVIIDHHDRGQTAGAHAAAGVQGELAVRGDGAGDNAQLLFHGVEHGGRALDIAAVPRQTEI